MPTLPIPYQMLKTPHLIFCGGGTAKVELCRDWEHCAVPFFPGWTQTPFSGRLAPLSDFAYLYFYPGNSLTL